MSVLTVLVGREREGRPRDARGVAKNDPHWQVVSLGGVTNIGNALGRYERVAGLCDSGEERFFLKGLERAGFGENLDRAAMEQFGFFVCEGDLELELIRSLGIEGIEKVVVDQLGQLKTLRTFQNQPFQRTRTRTRTRTTEQQLRRFMGTMSGRKSLYAEALVRALDVIPRPLEQVLQYALRAD